MRLWICFFVLAAALAAADKKPAHQPAKQQAARKRAARVSHAPARQPLTLPAGAVETAVGTWTWTDPQGKDWIYRKTPFGLTRFPAASAPAEAESSRKPADLTKAVEHGDSIEFSRPGPFGIYKWERKKADLTSEEKAIWDRARAGRQEPGKE